MWATHRRLYSLSICTIFDFSDIDECVNSTTLCHELAICINNIGNYTCKCMSGYEGDGVNSCVGKYMCIAQLMCTYFLYEHNKYYVAG